VIHANAGSWDFRTSCPLSPPAFKPIPPDGSPFNQKGRPISIRLPETVFGLSPGSGCASRFTPQGNYSTSEIFLSPPTTSQVIFNWEITGHQLFPSFFNKLSAFAWDCVG
jgi:hypothetical protein